LVFLYRHHVYIIVVWSGGDFMDKKLVVIPLSILLCVTMLASLAPQVIAQSTGTNELADTNQPTVTRGTMAYVSKVVAYAGFVDLPNNFLYSFDKFSVFLYYGSSSYGKIVGQMNAKVSSGSVLVVRAAIETNAVSSCTMRVYVSTDNSNWTELASKTVNSQSLTDFTYTNVPNFEYITVVANSNPGALYVDGAITY